MPDFLFSVAGLLTAFGVLAVWRSARSKTQGACRFLGALVIFFVLACSYVVPYGVSRAFIAGFRPLMPGDLPPGPTAIVLLGGDTTTVHGWGEETLSGLGPVGASRTLEAFRVHVIRPDAWIISSGGTADAEHVAASEAAVMRDALVRLGVPGGRILIESASRDTHDEAVLVDPMLRSLNVQHVVLVTSDVHMRRSVGAFRAVGWDAIPAIARDPYAGQSWTGWLVPSERGLRLSSSLTHETAGMVYYWMRGWWRA